MHLKSQSTLTVELLSFIVFSHSRIVP